MRGCMDGDAGRCLCEDVSMPPAGYIWMHQCTDLWAYRSQLYKSSHVAIISDCMGSARGCQMGVE